MPGNNFLHSSSHSTLTTVIHCMSETKFMYNKMVPQSTLPATLLYLPLASSFSLCTVTAKLSFSSNSFSKKAFLSIACK